MSRCPASPETRRLDMRRIGLTMMGCAFALIQMRPASAWMRGGETAEGGRWGAAASGGHWAAGANGHYGSGTYGTTSSGTRYATTSRGGSAVASNGSWA